MNMKLDDEAKAKRSKFEKKTASRTANFIEFFCLFAYKLIDNKKQALDHLRPYGNKLSPM
jgi:geranylgeranyl pyrophosphate synthase